MNTNPGTITRDRSRTGALVRGAATMLFALALVAVSAGSAQADEAGAQSQLTPIVGQGSGLVIVSPTSRVSGAFDARVTVNIQNAAPETTFAVTRAIDRSVDGICTNPQFDTVATIVTSPGGAGAVEFERGTTLFESGSAFDLKLLINGSDGTILQSDCMTIHVK
jgi:hypothetical protein